MKVKKKSSSNLSSFEPKHIIFIARNCFTDCFMSTFDFTFSCIVDGMTVNDALMVVMYKQSQDDDENGTKKSEVATTAPKSAEKLNGKLPVKTDLENEDEDEEEDDGMPVELEWGDDAANGDGPQVFKLEVETFQYTNGDRTQEDDRTSSDPRETPDRNFSSPGENLTHADMDLLRRARLETIRLKLKHVTIFELF